MRVTSARAQDDNRSSISCAFLRSILQPSIVCNSPPEECDKNGYHSDMKRFPEFNPSEPQPVYVENYEAFWDRAEPEEEYRGEARTSTKRVCLMNRERKRVFRREATNRFF